MTLPLTLTDVVYSEIDAKYFPERMAKSMIAIHDKRGLIYVFIIAIEELVATLPFIFSYFCVEGAVRSFDITAQDINVFSRIRPLGDIGGWLSLPIFSFIGLKTVISSLVKEGEIIRVQSICKKWLQENGSIDPETLGAKITYDEILNLLIDFNKRSFFSRSLASLHLKTIKLDLKDPRIELKPHLKNVTKKIDQASCFSKICVGQKTIGEGGRLYKAAALVFSVALPITLFANALFSLIGQVGLGRDLFYNRTDLEDTGHFGEWPINANEALLMAYFLIVWYLLNEGTFTIAKMAYTKEFEKLKEKKDLHNHLCDIANAELVEMAFNCNLMRYRNHFQFKKI